MISGHTAVYALLGSPVRHSRSPQMHNHWFATHGIDGVYVALEVAPDNGPHLLHAFRTLGLAGANITVPHKQAVLDALDAVDPLAAAIGAVNTLVRRDDGSVFGTNTDAPGLVAGIEDAFGPVRGARAVVLGAGGAGRAAAAGLADAGASQVTVLNRTEAKAHQVAADLAGFGRIVGGPLTQAALDAPQPTLVVNALSGPGAAQIRDWSVDGLDDTAVYVDLNYWMPNPPLVQAWRDRGGRVQDGLPMLAWQGAKAFAHFTGVTADPKPILQRWAAER